VLIAIAFDDEAVGEADEVDNVGVDGLSPAKLDPG
jgi:hypothetical protein